MSAKMSNCILAAIICETESDSTDKAHHREYLLITYGHSIKTFWYTSLYMQVRYTVAKVKIIMNHDSGFIIGIAHVFYKNPNRTHT